MHSNAGISWLHFPGNQSSLVELGRQQQGGQQQRSGAEACHPGCKHQPQECLYQRNWGQGLQTTLALRKMYSSKQSWREVPWHLRSKPISNTYQHWKNKTKKTTLFVKKSAQIQGVSMHHGMDFPNKNNWQNGSLWEVSQGPKRIILILGTTHRTPCWPSCYINPSHLH